MSEKHLLLTGRAGTGKTHTAIATASKSDKKIVIVRNVVAVRDIGFLPGTVDEKLEPYFDLYKDVFRNTGTKTPLSTLIKKQKLQFVCTSFLRGMTFDNCTVIVDEAQNLSYDELSTTLTRLGKESRLIIVGDSAQTDLSKSEEGFTKFSDIFGGMKSVHAIQLKEQHRSELLTEFFNAEARYEK